MRYEEDIAEEELPYLRQCLFLFDIVKNPISTVVERYRRLGVNPKTGNRWKDFLILKGIIIPKRIITKSGWIVLFEITETGRITLQNNGYNIRPASESIEHRFWKEKIADYYKKQGYDVAIEEGADIAIKKGKNRIAIEIETGNSDHLNNIERNLASGFDSVICVPTNRVAQYKITEDIEENDFGKKIKVVLAFKFDVTLKTNPEKRNKENGIL
jgi:hypothetical protein